MDAIRRTSTLRRVATTASLAALLIAPGTADAAKKKSAKKPKSPVITSVSPMDATVGDTLTIKGRNFRKGKAKNSVGFKRDGAAVMFVRAGVSTTKVMAVKIPSRLEKLLYGGTPATFHLRVLSSRFGKAFTKDKLSPSIAPRPAEEAPAADPANPTATTTPDGTTPSGTPAPTEAPKFDPAGPDGDCDGDGVANKNESGDIDNDLLSDALENSIGTDACKADSDDDGVSDAYEYKSAIDLNDDEYQSPQTAIPYPGARPYPNPLNADADLDYDGDSLTLGEEYGLWSKQGGRTAGETFTDFAATHLTYSDGLQYSIYTVDGSGHRQPSLEAATYAKKANFFAWAAASGYATVTPPVESVWSISSAPVDIRDVDRDGSVSTGCPSEDNYDDYDCNGYLADDERDEDADGLTNYDETHGRMLPGYWESCYTSEAAYKIPYAGTDPTNPDSDGDGIRDGADDQDHDDLPNMMELSRVDASHLFDGKNSCVPLDGLDPDTPNHPDAYGKVNPFNPCDPTPTARTCDRHPLIGATPDPDWWSLQ